MYLKTSQHRYKDCSLRSLTGLRPPSTLSKTKPCCYCTTASFYVCALFKGRKVSFEVKVRGHSLSGVKHDTSDRLLVVCQGRSGFPGDQVPQPDG